ncbi:hypothetical protein J6590_104208, partial [Homalodisca vitripennis]
RRQCSEALGRRRLGSGAFDRLLKLGRNRPESAHRHLRHLFTGEFLQLSGYILNDTTVRILKNRTHRLTFRLLAVPGPPEGGPLRRAEGRECHDLSAVRRTFYLLSSNREKVRGISLSTVAGTSSAPSSLRTQLCPKPRYNFASVKKGIC